MDQGFDNVQALLGGFAAWQEAGLPVEEANP
jgi:rhodanese-related sulfurtransferase